VIKFLDCAGRAERRRRFRYGAAGPIGSDRSRRYPTLESGVALRLPPHSKIGRGRFWTAPAERSDDGAFETERRVRLVHTARSLARVGKRCRAALATALQNCNGVQVIARKIPWPHAPEHRLCSRGTYFVTASTYLRQHHFAGKTRLAVLHRGLLKLAAEFRWRLEAWAVFSNHYHWIGHSPELEDTAESLSRMLGSLHEKTAKWVNRLDATKGHKVWHNFRETRLTYEKSYLARLNYVHQNPVRHGLVSVANQYPWCSARWFERTASPAQIKTIYRFKIDKITLPDEFEVSPDW